MKEQHVPFDSKNNEPSREEVRATVNNYREELIANQLYMRSLSEQTTSSDEEEAHKKDAIRAAAEQRKTIRTAYEAFVGPELAAAYAAFDKFSEDDRKEGSNKYDEFKQAEAALAAAEEAFYGKYEAQDGEKETSLEGDAKDVEEALGFFEKGKPIDPEKLQDALIAAFGETVTEGLTPRMRERLRTEEKLHEVLERMIANKRGAEIEGSPDSVALFKGIFDADDLKAGLDGSSGSQKALPAGTQGDHLQAPANPDTGDTTPAEMTPEQRERAEKLDAAADKLAALKAQPFYKRDKAAIEAAKAEYDAIAQEVGREIVAEAPDEASRQAHFAAVQVAMWRDINSRVADLRKDTKYGRIVEKLGSMSPVARMGIMAGAGLVTGAAAAAAGALIGGGAAVAVGVGATVTMTKVARAKLSADVSLSEANQQRTKGTFDELMAKFGQVSGLVKLGARGERKLQAKYDSKAEARKTAIKEQAAQEGWDTDRLIAKLARVDAGQDTHMIAARGRKALGVSMAALGLGIGAGAVSEHIVSGMMSNHDGAATPPSGNHDAPKAPEAKPINGNQLSPVDAFNLSYKTEMDFLNTNGRVHNDFNNIPVNSVNTPEHANLFPGYDALQNEYQKSPMELSAQLHQIQTIEMANGHKFDVLPQNLQLQPGENPDAYAARLSDAIHHDQALHDKLTGATMDYLKVHGQPKLLEQSYYSWWIDKNGIAHWEQESISSNDPTDVIIKLSETKGIRLPCGQPIELIPITPHVQQAVYHAPPVVSHPAPAPAPEAPAPISETVLPPPTVPLIPIIPNLPPVPQPPIPTTPIEGLTPKGVPQKFIPNNNWLGGGDAEGNTPKPVQQNHAPAQMPGAQPAHTQASPEQASRQGNTQVPGQRGIRH